MSIMINIQVMKKFTASTIPQPTGAIIYTGERGVRALRA